MTELTEGLSWTTLITIGGATAFTLLVVQLTKGWKYTANIPTRIYSYIIALTTLVIGTFFVFGVSLEHLILCFFNAILVATSASGSYDVIEMYKEKE